MARPKRQPRPLDGLHSIKVKLGVIVVASVVATVGAIYWSIDIGIQARFAFLIGIFVSLLVIQVLAHGLVLPLREMARASQAMTTGDYSQRVTATSQDEVGTLALAFNAMAGQLEQVEAQRRDLVANVSHELRTPIASLRARLENLADGVEQLDQAAVDAMLRSIQRLSGLVDQLLDLSRFESGAVELTLERFDVAAAVDAATREVGPVRPDVDLAVDVAPGLHADGDATRIHQVLTNLLTNAIRVSPTDGTVETRATATPAGVRLEVLDHGPGIPDSELDAVFGRFHRLDAARSGTTGGAGLGLAIARSIVELHGGSIRAESRPPHGCRMVVDLPS